MKKDATTDSRGPRWRGRGEIRREGVENERVVDSKRERDGNRGRYSEERKFYKKPEGCGVGGGGFALHGRCERWPRARGERWYDKKSDARPLAVLNSNYWLPRSPFVRFSPATSILSLFTNLTSPPAITLPSTATPWPLASQLPPKPLPDPNHNPPPLWAGAAERRAEKTSKKNPISLPWRPACVDFDKDPPTVYTSTRASTPTYK